jgi:RNA polymerase sigma-70 factor (ECF subfamily)
MTGNPETALDLAQDTYLRAFTRIEQFDGRSAFGTWLYRIAVTEALQFLRREKRFRGSLQVDGAEPAVDSSSDQTAERLDVDQALASLEPGDRAILLLRYQEGQSYRAIAEALECEEGTVASRLNRARNRVREILGKGYAPEEEGDAVEHQMDGDTGRAGIPASGSKPSARGPGQG